MRWLPTFTTTEQVLCYDDGEAEGWEVLIEWLGFVIEIIVARRVRMVERDFATSHCTKV